MNERLKSKLSIGISMDIEVDQYKDLLEDYSYYLDSVYFSPPLGNKFHTREKIAKQLSDKDNVIKLYKIIDLFYKHNIKIDCVLNRPSLKENDIIKALKFIRNEMPVDQITCLDRNIEIINEFFPNIDKIYSYNNDLTVKKIPTINKSFSTVVAGKFFLRDENSLKKIVDNGFKVKLLVNNGCSFNCYGCQKGNRLCEEVFNNNLRYKTIEELYALQSFFPNELDSLLLSHGHLIDTIKISNRTSDYAYLKNCLKSYINVEDVDPYIMQDFNNYRLWLRLGWFSDKLSILNLDKVKQEKAKLMVKKDV